MIKNLLKGLLGKVIKNKALGEVIAAEIDAKAKRALDKKTGGLASKVDEVI